MLSAEWNDSFNIQHFLSVFQNDANGAGPVTEVHAAEGDLGIIARFEVAEIAQVEAQADALREESDGAAADVITELIRTDRLQLQRVDRRGIEQADAARDERTQSVFVPASRRREDDIAHDRQRAALDDVEGGSPPSLEWRVVLLEEAWRVRHEAFDADRATAYQRDDPPKVQCTLSVACSASSSVVSPLKVKPRNGVSCQSALRGAGRRR